MLLRHSRVALLHFFISITHSLSSSSLQLQTLNQPQLSNQTCLIEASSSLASAFPSKCLNTFSILGQDCQALLNDKGNAIVRCLGESDLNKLLDSALESNAAPLNKAIPSRWLVLVKNHMEKCLALKDLDIILESVLLWVFVETHVLEDAVAFLEQSEDSRLISAPQHNKLEQKTAGKCWKALVSPSMKSNILGWEEGDCFGPLDPATEKPIKYVPFKNLAQSNKRIREF